MFLKPGMFDMVTVCRKVTGAHVDLPIGLSKLLMYLDNVAKAMIGVPVQHIVPYGVATIDRDVLIQRSRYDRRVFDRYRDMLEYYSGIARTYDGNGIYVAKSLDYIGDISGYHDGYISVLVLELRSAEVCVGDDAHSVMKRVGAPDVIIEQVWLFTDDVAVYDVYDLRRDPLMTSPVDVRLPIPLQERVKDPEEVVCRIADELGRRGIIQSGEADVAASLDYGYSVRYVRTRCVISP